MTFAELTRQIDSKERMFKLEAKEKASNNYIHAILVGKALITAFDNKTEFPEIHEVYPSLFQKSQASQEAIVEQQDLLSALRFKQFAKSFNENFYKEEAKEE